MNIGAIITYATKRLTTSVFGLLSVLTVSVGLLPVACSDIPTVSLGIDDYYIIYRMQKLALSPALSGEEYRWSIDGETVSTDRDFIFLAEAEGEYEVTFDIIDPATPYSHTFTVSVIHEEIEYSPYISRVYEYCPAPGQFINTMPQWDEGDTYDDILQKAEDCISGTNDIMISLGGYGGYVTFGFDHTVINRPGEYDFRVWGNCFYELTDPSTPGGSAEPGIVMVSYDTNCNGIPDDEWYELAGSEYGNTATLHDYSITYQRPVDDNADVEWLDSRGVTGSIPKNQYHSQAYFPKWIADGEIRFSGSLLPKNGVDTSGNGTYYILYSYPWGYVDNHPNDEVELNSFDISWAVDRDGNRVQLPGVDFIRVYTGVNQVCGWLGETSTELSKAQDLHIEITQ